MAWRGKKTYQQTWCRLRRYVLFSNTYRFILPSHNSKFQLQKVKILFDLHTRNTATCDKRKQLHKTKQQRNIYFHLTFLINLGV